MYKIKLTKDFIDVHGKEQSITQWEIPVQDHHLTLLENNKEIIKRSIDFMTQVYLEGQDSIDTTVFIGDDL